MDEVRPPIWQVVVVTVHYTCSKCQITLSNINRISITFLTLLRNICIFIHSYNTIQPPLGLLNAPQ